jgi:hypothetical protein
LVGPSRLVEAANLFHRGANMREVGWFFATIADNSKRQTKFEHLVAKEMQPLQDVRARANQVLFRSLWGQAILLYGGIFHFYLC